MVFVFWIILAFVCGFFGKERECGFGWAFFWGLVFPLIGILVVAFSKRKKTVFEALNELEIMRNNGMIDAITYSQVKTALQCGIVKPISSYNKEPMSNKELIIQIVCIIIIMFILIQIVG